MSSAPPFRITRHRVRDGRNDGDMAEHLDLNGVHTWYDDRGTGDPLVLLHGGLTDSRDFTGNLDALAGDFRLLLPERRGHGHTPDVPGPYAMAALADDTAAFVERTVGGPVRLAGYSAGATVALWTAVRRPDLVERLVLISGAFDPAGMIVRPSTDGEPPRQLVDAYAEVSPDGADHFAVVLAKIVRSIDEDTPLTQTDLATVRCPVLLVVADDDIVTLEHTIAAYRALPHAQLAVVPGTSHVLLHEKPELCARIVGDFLSGDATPTTWMPLSRAVEPASSGRPAGTRR